MDRDFFLNAGLHFEPSSQMPAWKLPEVNCRPGQPPADRFHHPNWEKSTDQYSQLESALSSMVSSPASNSAVSNDAFAIRELIGKLGSICNAGGEVSQAALTAVVAGTDPYNNTNTSCYSTPLNSPPPKLNMPIMDHFVKESLPSVRNSMPLNPGLPSLVADPGFAERAAKFSCFASRSFNGRTSQFGLNTNNPDFQFRSSVSPLVGNTKLPRVSSSPSLKIDGSPMTIQDKNSAETHMEIRSGADKKFSRLSGSAANSNEESSVSEQIPSGEIGLKIQNDSNSRKRKATPRGKAKEIASAATKEGEAKDDSSTKRLKQTEQENGGGRTEEDPRNNNKGAVEEGQNQAKDDTKPPEPSKDYIHVRARRGQATDSHSLAERVRREKISERMKLLQDLVPGCNKVTGKALMLDEIINYVQSLQRQVEFLSMKLATVNPSLDFDMNSLLSKDMNQSNGNLAQHMYPMESSASAFYQQNPQQLLFNGSGYGSAPMTQSSVDTLPPPPPPVHGFTEAFPHFPGFGEDDLHSIVLMGFPERLNQDATFQPSQNFQSPNQTSEMKIEL